MDTQMMDDKIDAEMAAVDGEPNGIAEEPQSIEIGGVKIPSGALDDQTLQVIRERIEAADRMAEERKLLSAQISPIQQKAELYDRMSRLVDENPGVGEAIRRAVTGEIAVDPDAFGEGIDASVISKHLERIIDAKLSPLMERYTKLDRILSVQNELGSIAQKDPKVRDLEPKIREIVDQYGIPVEAAYKIAVHDNLMNQVRDAERLRRGNIATANGIRKPSGAEVARPSRVDPKTLSREGVIEMALQQIEAKAKNRTL